MNIKYHKNGQIDLRETIGTVENAIQIMHDGVQKQLDRDGFIVDMIEYGYANDGICYGCAATCAIQQITNKNYTVDTIGLPVKRSIFMNIERKELSHAEACFNDLSQGYFECMRSFLTDTSIIPPANWYFLMDCEQDSVKQTLNTLKRYLDNLKIRSLHKLGEEFV